MKHIMDEKPPQDRLYQLNFNQLENSIFIKNGNKM